MDDRRIRSLALVLFVLTAASILDAGGPKLVIALMAILLAHEMGHLVACRLHGVDSTWPLFLPMPIFITGTAGALMIIRQRFPSRRALFDIGVAGPLAGFLVCLPIMALGIREAAILPADAAGAETLGDPLLLSGAFHLLRELPPAGHAFFIGRLGLAAWFGLLLTGLNLIPIGQLDGGHILYALFPRYAQRISRLAWLAGLALAIWTPAWLFWALVMAVLGRRPHPTTADDSQPIGRAREAIAALALIVFVLTFIPQPIEMTWPEWLRALGLIR